MEGIIMKKTFFAIYIAAAAIIAASCNKEQPEPIQPVNSEEGITFVGEYLTTKMTVGDKVDNAYPLLWSEGDQLTITSTADNSKKGIATLQSGAGTKSGVFFMPATEGISVGTEVIVSFGPEEVPADQVVDSAAARDVTNSLTSASAPITITDGPVGFSLANTAAVAKVTVSSSEFSAMKLKSVMIYSKGASLAGDSDYAEVTFSNPATLSSAQEVFIATKPITSATDFFVVATMIDDTRTVTIPVEFEGKTLQAGKVNAIKLENLTLSSNSCAQWYEAVETRNLLGGWAYGEANMFFVGTEDTEVEYTYEVKARGRFNKVSQPAYYGFIMFKDRNQTSFLKLGTGAEKVDLWTDSVDNFVPRNDNQTISPNCEFSVKTLASSADPKTTFCVIGIYNADKELIWSFMVQRYRKGDEPCGIDYPNGITMLDRALGQDMGSKTLSDDSVESGDLNCYGALFQWGRKDPFAYNTPQKSGTGWEAGGQYQYGKYRPGEANAAGDALSTIENSIKHPYRAYLLSTSNSWMLNMPTNLWGSDGTKTIYDPCPAGYRVCDESVLKDVMMNGERWERYNTVKQFHVNADSNYDHATYYGGSCVAYPLGGGKYDYWISNNYSSGSKFDTNPTGGGPYIKGNNETSSDSGFLYWSNASTSSNYGTMYQNYYAGKSGQHYNNIVPNQGAATLIAVRCQKI